jgi:adenylate cyclase
MASADDDGFSAKLALIMDAFNLSRVAVARELGIDKSVVSRWLNGVNRPTEHNLTRLTEIVRKRHQEFTLRLWRGPLSDFAVALGQARQEVWSNAVEVRGDQAPMPAAPERAVLALPSKPSIAVLPFTNMSNDPGQEFFSDGIAEDITTTLSRFPSLFVIARNSSFTYKGRSVDIKEIGRNLGVRYVLEGSVRKAGDHCRVTGQLIEAESGTHLWAERYDRTLLDIFAVQDEITANVCASILPRMERAERERVARKPPDDLDAWEAYHRGMWHFCKLELPQTERARAFFMRAVEIDPNFADAHSGIAMTFYTEATLFRPPKMRHEIMVHVAEHAGRAITADPTAAVGHFALSTAHMLAGRHQDGIAEADLAVSLDPNLAWAHGGLGASLAFGGKPADAIEPLHLAMRLSPFDPIMSRWLHYLSRAHYWAGDYEMAAQVARQLCQSFPNVPAGLRTLIASLGQTGDTEETASLMTKGLAHFGDDFRDIMLNRVPELRPEDFEHLLDGYRKAGMVR